MDHGEHPMGTAECMDEQEHIRWLVTSEEVEPNAHLDSLGSYICHCLEGSYDYLETLSKGAGLREIWESKSGFLGSGVRYFRARSPGLLPPPRGGRGGARHWSLDKKPPSILSPVAGRPAG